MSMKDDVPWKDVTAAEVATVAAKLMQEDSGHATDAATVARATRLALQLIEAANYGLTGLYEKTALWDGVDRWEAQQANRAKLWAAVKKLPPGWPDEKTERIPFEAALARLLPKINQADRMRIFRGWLADGGDSIEAGKQIATLKQEGFPRRLFETARLFLPDWRAKCTSAARSAAGKKGAAKKAGKKATGEK